MLPKTFFFTFFFLPFSSLYAQELPIYQAKAQPDIDFFETIDGQPGEVFPGCSWYCGGSVHRFLASSHLPNYKNISYGPESAHDFNITTAWVEGADDYGVGEKITYIFDFREMPEHQLGITHLVIANGYKKSESLWKKNSRVKTLRVYLDDQPYADLALLDTISFQRVEIGKIMLPQDTPLHLTFEILEVYPGDVYADTAISELLIEGVGVH